MVSQIQGGYEEKNEKMAQYLALAHSLIAQFMKFEVTQVPRSKNRMVDALTNLAFSVPYPYHAELDVLAPSNSEELVFIAMT